MKIGTLVVLAGMAAMMLGGCGQGKYERIGLPGETGALAETVEIRIGEPGGSRDQEGGGHGQAGPEGGNRDQEAGPEGGDQKQAGQEDGTREQAGEDGEITLLFGGDVYLSDHVLGAWEAAGGIQGVLDEGYRQVIGQADYFMVNQEFPFSSRGVQAPDKQFTFRLPPERVEIFGQMGIDGVTLANNHALDFGQEALLDSCAVLDEAGIGHTGAGENLEEAGREISLELSGRKIAMIGATRVIPVSTWAAGNHHAGMLATYDPAVLLERIRQLKQDHDYVMVYVHWGIERDQMPQEYQRTLGRQFLDAGADLVVGAHPHVLQGIEYLDGKPVVYSLGNFVFGSSIPRTMLLEVTIPAEGREDELKLRVIPGTSSAGYTRMHQEPGALEEFYRYLEGISFGTVYGNDGTVIRDRHGQ